MTAGTETEKHDLARIVREHQRDIWRFLMALGCQPAEAEDLTQETFVAVFRGGFEYRGPNETASYLRKAAKHRFISSVRRRRRSPVVRNLDDVDVEWGRFESRCDGDRRVELLQRCLETLGDRARDALAMRYRDDLSRADIAAKLDMKDAGVRTLLDRARTALRECVERKLKGHD
ncbi:MAG: sigma-70 family RNA polymerase sigma factor [Planctomycetes bacterium]|nr:sigma-70 family RNA polymerase sigma factor [Planctomycetota bacterium]